MSFHVPEQYRFRDKNHVLYSETKDGNNGAFFIKIGSDIFQCIASNGRGWEHVSITIRTKSRNTFSTPSWEQMCAVKNLFWDEEDTVIQYHPAKSNYVNNHEHVLHLWRPTNQVIPIPDSIMVGIK